LAKKSILRRVYRRELIMGYYYRITDKKGNVMVRDITGSELLGGTTNLSTVVRAVADRWSEDEEYSFFQSVTAEGMEMVERIRKRKDK